MIDYDAHNWTRHLFDIRGSVLKAILGRVLACVAFAAAVVWVHRHVHPIAVPSTVHGLVGVALGLLLVFRTNASYDRFWEGRKMWGGIVNESRNLARLACAHLGREPALLETLVRWAMAWPYSAMHSLRGQRGLGPVASELPAREVEQVLAAQHVPVAVALRLTQLLAEARQRGLLSDYLTVALDQNLQLLMDYLGACERIHRTPLPFAYVVHLRRSLILYCFTLPFALLEPFGWATLPCTLLVAYSFFGIEEIGVEIEDPFGTDDNDLPLERICDTIRGNLLGLLARPAAPEQLDPPQPAAEPS